MRSTSLKLRISWYRRIDQCVFSLHIQHSELQEDTQSTASLSESLLEALESIQESKQTTSFKFSRQGSPFRNTVDPDRLTDYPVRSSSPDSVHLKSHGVGSHRSSLSTVSESSLTSEGSISFDMNKKPGKNILKRSHDPRRRSKNRVRWNLPNGEVNDSDTTSLESFDSSTAGSGIHYRARNAVLESRRNWREFERSPSPGSTGLTPAKHLRPLREHVRSPSPTQLRNRYNTRSPSPSGSPFKPPQASSPKSVPTILVSEAPIKETVGDHRRSPSPLDSSPVRSPKRSPSSRHRQHRMMHSTPMRRCNSDANTALTGYNYSSSEGSANQQSDGHIHGKGNESTDDVFNMSPLKLNHSNLSELEASTLEERQKKHLFEFPQHHAWHRQRARKTSAPPAYSGIITRPSATSFGDDKDDYDHLSPLSEERRKDGGNTKDLSTVYCEKDIDEALKKLVDDESSTSESQPQSPSTAEPPPLPPRIRKDSSTQRTLPPHNHNSPQSHGSQPSTAPPPISPTEVAPVVLQDNVAEQKSKQRRIPPPVPPKRYRIGKENRDKNGNPLQYPTVPAPLKGKYKALPPLPENSPAQEQNADRQPPAEQHETQHTPPAPPSTNISTRDNISQNTSNDVEDEIEDILPPPPEFAEMPTNQSPNNELGSDGELSQSDALGSVSNTTLVGDQDDSSPTASQKNTNPSSSSLGELEELSSNPLQYQNSGSDGKTDAVAVHPDPVSHSHIQLSSWNPERSTKESNHVRVDTSYQESFLPQGNPMKTLHTGPDSPVEGYSVKLVQLHTQSSIPPPVPNLRPKHSGQYPSQMAVAQDRVQPQAKAVQKDVITNSKVTKASIPHHKTSLEAAFAEENLLGRTSYTSAHTRPKYRRTSHEMNSTKSPNLQEGRSPRLRRTTSTPHHSKHLPPNHTLKQFSPTDQHLLQTFYSGQKLPTMKPVIHDTERSIEQMLAELESDGSGDEKRPCGKCMYTYDHFHAIVNDVLRTV